MGILGATGTVGQKLIVLLRNHPWFEIAELAASERSAGKPYAEACAWKQEQPIPADAAQITVMRADEPLESPVIFSGLDASAAGPIEKSCAERGQAVFSNAKNHRMDRDVPLVIPEINPDHFELTRVQTYRGAIITNCNCVVMPLAMVLAPLHRAFGVKWVQLTSMQAISGAGYPGVASYDILGNVVPYIGGEEPKVEVESQKILGTLKNGGIEPAEFAVSAQCMRVPVIDGHTETLSIAFRGAAPPADEVKGLLREWRGMPQEKKLPSAPEIPVVVHDAEDRPQPALDIRLGGGMTVSAGRVRDCSVGDVKMVILSHNTVRGAAGAAILNAEAYVELGYTVQD